MPNDRSANGLEALGRSTMAAKGEDGALLALEAQLDDLVAQLLAAQEGSGEQIPASDQLPAVPDSERGDTETASVRDGQAKDVEAILARLYPIERAIMAACTIVGLGVKARHAAYVMSQYWENPAGKIDWESQVVRLLIEAVCDVARTPSSFLTRGK